MRLARALLLLALVAGCGSPSAPAYVREAALAERARDQGQHLEAARRYERAASVAGKPRDAEEARYRAADAYARGGDAARAEALYRELARSTDGERSARADFAIAELWSKAGREEEARAHRLAALRRHPSSGLAARALTSHLAYLRERGGSPEVLNFLQKQGNSLGIELGETVAYRRARELDDQGKHAEARNAYLACAASFPYPAGAYWDDALYRAAEQELALGAPERALEHLTRMLAEQEEASVNGSYQRGRYAEAQLKIATIYRDVLRDAARARRELRKVWELHPRSRLVDDALFQEALLARQSGDAAGACAPLGIIASKLPDSRYAPCAHLLCNALPETTGRACRAYIQREAGITTTGASDAPVD